MWLFNDNILDLKDYINNARAMGSSDEKIAKFFDMSVEDVRKYFI